MFPRVPGYTRLSRRSVRRPMDEHLRPLAEAYRSGRVGRRTFVRWAATLGLAAPAISTLLAACTPTAPGAPPAGGSAPPAPAAAAGSAANAQLRRGGMMRVTGSPT